LRINSLLWRFTYICHCMLFTIKKSVMVSGKLQPPCKWWGRSENQQSLVWQSTHYAYGYSNITCILNINKTTLCYLDTISNQRHSENINFSKIISNLHRQSDEGICHMRYDETLRYIWSDTIQFKMIKNKLKSFILKHISNLDFF